MSARITFLSFAWIPVFSMVMAQPTTRIWHVKAILADGRTLDVKAFDPQGGRHDVKAMDEGATHLMDVRAMAGDKSLPIKIIASQSAFLPVKAIAPDGALWDVKALDAEGRQVDVKAVGHAGSILHVKAVHADLSFSAIKAIDPDGHMRDIKGIRTVAHGAEDRVNGVDIHAHLKAISHADGSDVEVLWNVKGVGADGHTMDIKAIDAKGGIHPVKAFIHDGDASLLEVKAMVNGDLLPIKVIHGEAAPHAVKAIGTDGTVYDVKAFAADGRRLDVKAVERQGRVLAIKVLAPDGRRAGVKAISPRGAFRDVKGIKLKDDAVEGVVNGVRILAHIKGLAPADDAR